MKWPWYSATVDYDYFTFRTFRTKYWPKIQFLLMFFYIIPTLYYAIERGVKYLGTKGTYDIFQNLKPKIRPNRAHPRKLERRPLINIR